MKEEIEKKESLEGCICPKVGCGVLVPSKEKNGWVCNACNQYVKDRADWWVQMEVFQKEACVSAIEKILREKPETPPNYKQVLISCS